MQSDGNFVVYGPSGATWNSGTQFGDGGAVVMQSDGNLVIYASGNRPVWSTGSVYAHGGRLVMQGDGNLVVRDDSDRPAWSSFGGRTGITSDVLNTDQQLWTGQSLWSSDGRYRAAMQPDGNFVVYGPNGATWNSGTKFGDGGAIAMQGDGNLVVYAPGLRAVWSSGSRGPGARLSMQTDGNLVVYSGNTPLWSSRGGLVSNGGGAVCNPRCGTGITLSTSALVNLRSAPSAYAAYLGAVTGGAPVTITCQSYGTKFNGSFIWDYIGSGYISDAFVNGTPFNSLDPRVPRCGTNYQPVDCDKILFLGVRGSGEPSGPLGMGAENTSPVDRVFRRLASLGGNLDAAGVNYPAQGVDILLSGQVDAYFDGMAQGRAETLRLLRQRTDGNVCGWQHTKTVLVGYSQGAYVVGDTIEQMTPAERTTIRGIATFGNPRYSPFANGDVSRAVGLGIAGPRGAYPDNVSARAQDYCATDIVCAGRANVAGVLAHKQYVGNGSADAAATFLRSRL